MHTSINQTTAQQELELAKWRDLMTLAGKSERTIDSYIWHLRQLMLVLDKPTEDVTGPELVGYLAGRSRNQWGPSSVKLSVNAIKSYFHFALGEKSPARELKVMRPKRKQQRTLNAAQAFAILASCDTSTPRGQRDLALLCLMLDTGLRSAEICNLKVSEVHLSERWLRTKIKGGHEGDGVFTNYTAMQLAAWMTERERIVAPGVEELFLGIGGLKPGTKISPKGGLRLIIRKIGKAAGIGALSPHDLRRTFATLCIRYGAPTRLVQVAGRWESLEQLEQYTMAIQPSDIDEYLPINRLMGFGNSTKGDAGHD